MLHFFPFVRGGSNTLLRIGRSVIVGSRLTRQQSGLPLPAARERLPRRQGDPRAQCGMRTRTALVTAPFRVGTFSNVRCHSVSARGLLPMEIRPNVGTALAACRANETWLERGGSHCEQPSSSLSCSYIMSTENRILFLCTATTIGADTQRSFSTTAQQLKAWLGAHFPGDWPNTVRLTTSVQCLVLPWKHSN